VDGQKQRVDLRINIRTCPGAKGFRTTAKGADVFIHIFDWPGRLWKFLRRIYPIQLCSLLETDQPLKFSQREGKMTIDLPAQAPDADATVIKLRST